jgi:4-amino-4-deoxy-L-arabinose transferase-like glycosyltransferase
MKFFKIIDKLVDKEDRKYFVFLLLLVILIKFPTMSLDYYWDEVLYAAQAKYYSIHGPFAIPPGLIIHVPLFQWILAFTFKIFGEQPFMSHLVVAIFSFTGTYFTYLLGKFLFNKYLGIIASLLLLFSPIYFAISGQVLFDVPLTSLSVVVMYYFLRKKLIYYLISAIFLVLTKEPGFIVIMGLLMYFYFIKKEKIKNIIPLSIPLFLFAFFEFWILNSTLEINKFAMLTQRNDLFFYILRFLNNSYQILFWNYNWLLSIPILFFLISKKRIPTQITPLFLIGFLFFALFTFTPVVLLPRYLLPIYPTFFIFSSYCINYIFKKRSWLYFLIIIFLFVSCYRWNFGLKGLIQDPVFHLTVFRQKPITSVTNGELSLDYIDALEVEEQALNFIFANYSNHFITVSYPLAENASLEVNVGNKQWNKYNITVLYPLSKENIIKSYLVVAEPYYFSEKSLKLLSDLKLVKKYEKNGKYVEIYKKNV